MSVWVTVMGGVVLISALLYLAKIDWAKQTLPNWIILPLIAAGLVWAFGTALDFYWHLLGAALGYGLLWTVEGLYRHVRKRDGLSRGDAKLMAIGGAWCGVWALPAIILISSLAALAYVLRNMVERSARIPFGPFLTFGIGFVWLVQRLF